MTNDTPSDTTSLNEDLISTDASAVAGVPKWSLAPGLERSLWLLPILALVALGFHFRWTFDDGFIYFRSVDQILAGNGPVFNEGERVESLTSPLWLGMLTIGDLIIPIRLEFIALWISLMCTAVGVGLATLASARISRRDRAGAVRLPVGLLVLVALWPTWVWSTSGMEVGLTYLWIGSCFLILARWSTRSSREPSEPGSAAMILLGLGWLVRPELVLASVLFVGLVIVMSQFPRRRRVRLVVVAMALPVLYQVFRMGYYGMLVATPAIAKEGSSLRPGHGWSYLVDFFEPYLLVVPLITIALAVGGPMIRSLMAHGEHRAIAVIVTVSGSGVVMAGYIVLVGGDYVHARLLIPSLFAFLAPFLVVAASSSYVEAIVITATWALICGFALRADEEPASFTLGYFGRNLTTEDRGFVQRGLGQDWIDGPGLYLGSTFTADGIETEIALAQDVDFVVATRAIGAMGYALGTEAKVVDLHGLADPLTAHQRLEFRSVPGHEKLAAAPWLVAFLADDPSAVMPTQLPIEHGLWPALEPLSFLDQVAWAQATLKCAPLGRLQEASSDPLTPVEFATNVWRSLPNTTIRLDRDPRQAFAEHCHGGFPDEVAALYDRVTFAAELPITPRRGELVVVNDCDAVFLADDRQSDQWLAVEGATFAATVHFDAADRTPRLASMFELSPIGTSNAVVWAETDGQGSYRFRLDIDWFAPILQPWTAIPHNGELRVSLAPDLAAERWALFVEWTKLADVPMQFNDEGRFGATTPTRLGTGSVAGSISVAHDPPVRSQICQMIKDNSGEHL